MHFRQWNSTRQRDGHEKAFSSNHRLEFHPHSDGVILDHLCSGFSRQVSWALAAWRNDTSSY